MIGMKATEKPKEIEFWFIDDPDFPQHASVWVQRGQKRMEIPAVDIMNEENVLVRLVVFVHPVYEVMPKTHFNTYYNIVTE